MDRKNTILLTVIAIATLLVAVVGATFAYFSAVNGGMGRSAVEVKTQVLTPIIVNAENKIALTASSENMIQEIGNNDKSVYSENASAAQQVSAYADNSSAANDFSCDFALKYIPTAVYKKSAENTENITELEISFEEVIEGSATINKTTNNATLDGKVYRYDITGVSSETVILGGTFIIPGGSSGKVAYNTNVRFYNLGINQDCDSNHYSGGACIEANHQGATFGGDIILDVSNCQNLVK